MIGSYYTVNHVTLLSPKDVYDTIAIADANMISTSILVPQPFLSTITITKNIYLFMVDPKA